MRPRPALVLVLVGGLWLSAGPARAQDAGRWSWRGKLGLGGIGNWYDGATPDEATEEQTRFSLGLEAGLTGFIIHPSIARFDLDLVGVLDRDEGGYQLDTRRIGGSANLRLFPQGKVRAGIGLSHSNFDYSQGPEGPTFGFRGSPASVSSAGGFLSLTNGPLGAFNLEGTATRITPWDSTLEGDDRLEGKATYRNTLLGFRTFAELRYSDQYYGQSNFQFRDLALNATGVRDINARSNVEATLVVDDQSSGDRDGVTAKARTARLSATLRSALSERVQATVTAGFGGAAAQSGSESSLSGFDLNATASWDLGGGFFLGPTFGYVQSSDENSTYVAPQAGLSATWQTQAPFPFNVRAQVDWRQSTWTFGDAKESSRDLAGSLRASASTPPGHPVSFSAAVMAGTNEARLSGEREIDLPGLGIVPAGSTTDSFDADLNGDWKATEFFTVRGRLWWRSLDTTAEVEGLAWSSTVARGEAGFRWRRVSFTAAASQVDTDSSAGESGRSEVTSLSFSWGAFRSLSFFAALQDSQSTLLLSPSYDIRRSDAGIEFSLGKLQARLSAFEEENQVADSPVRTNRGVSFQVTRSFSGWLGATSGIARRGTIR